MFFATLPLADKPCGYIEVAGKNGLTGFFLQPDIADLVGRQALNRRQAHMVKGLHGLLIQNTRLIKAESGFVDSSHHVIAELGFFKRVVRRLKRVYA